MNEDRWRALNASIAAMSPQERASWYQGLSEDEQWEVSQAYAEYGSSLRVGVAWQYAYFDQHPIALVAMRVAALVILAAIVIGAYLLLR